MSVVSAQYLSDSTIAALASAAGGPIAIVRLSGLRAFDLAEKLIGAAFLKWAPSTAHTAELKDQTGKTIDHALVLKFCNPHSFTGEDLVEFHLHGSPWVVRRCIDLLLQLGARAALPGEFSFRAVRNGKMTVPEAQAVADLISSRNDSAVRLAIEKLQGAHQNALTEIAESLKQVATLSEAGIDFSDQDLEEVSLPVLSQRLRSPIERLKTLAHSFKRGAQIQQGVPTAIIGLPNAGKSSLFNALLGEDRAIVSDIPGTTRDVLREFITLEQQAVSTTFRLLDTAGLRATQDPVEKIGVSLSQKAAAEAHLILFVSEPGGESEASESLFLTLEERKNIIGVLSKADLISKDQRDRIDEFWKKKFPSIRWIWVSAISESGFEELIGEMLRISQSETFRGENELLLTRQEHFSAVQDALSHLERALSAQELDLFAADIRQALHALNPLIGETLPDDILGRIFSQFCIGK